jgi:hypothetical protein
MATKDEIQTYAASIAEGTILTYLLAQHYKAQPDPEEFSRDHLRFLEQLTGKMPIAADLPAVEKDLVAQEIRDALIRRALRAQSEALGTRFDPTAFQQSWL